LVTGHIAVQAVRKHGGKRNTQRWGITYFEVVFPTPNISTNIIRVSIERNEFRDYVDVADVSSLYLYQYFTTDIKTIDI